MSDHQNSADVPKGPKGLKIGINATFLHEKPTGLGIFTREVSRCIVGAADNVIVYSPTALRGVAGDCIHKVPLAIGGSMNFKNNIYRLIYINTVLPAQCRLDRIDLLYCPMIEYPFVPLVPLVVHVHDLHPIMFPQQFLRASVHFSFMLRMLNRAARRVTVVSEYVKNELLATTKIPENRVDVIPNGYNKDLFQPQDPAMKGEFLEKYSISGNYILYVGNLFRYKNVKMLMEAFLRIKDRLDHSLVIVGRREFCDETLPCDDKIRFMNYVPDEDLPNFYSYADLLVHPSLSEGFGLTPLEAMACGTPVLSSNRASLPEVVGDAGILFNPADSETLSSLILEVLSNETLLKELKKKGFRQAAKFSWEKTAAGLLKSFEKAMNG